MSQLFTSSGKNIGASSPVFPMNIQGWFPLGLTGLISLQCKRLKSLLQHHNSKASILQHSAFFMAQLSHLYMTTGTNIALTIQTFVGKLISLLFSINTLSMFVIAFLPRSKCLNFMTGVTVCSDFRAQWNKICHCFHFFPFAMKWWDQIHDLSFLDVEFQASLFTLLSHHHQEVL